MRRHSKLLETKFQSLLSDGESFFLALPEPPNPPPKGPPALKVCDEAPAFAAKRNFNIFHCLIRAFCDQFNEPDPPNPPPPKPNWGAAAATATIVNSTTKAFMVFQITN